MTTQQKRDKISTSHGDSRIPVPKARRATGESIHRNQNGRPREPFIASSSAPSTPRPIPKKNPSTLQPKSGASSYSFDDSVINPFLPSTPPAFTPSMEPTAFSKPDPPKNISSSSTSTSTNKGTFGAGSRSAAPLTPVLPLSPPATIPSASDYFRELRSRDASVSSLPGPNHDDMILPAVARRIKEQGLFDHDVIAYSDDPDAPLYRLPTSLESINNPFAGYDRAKAASSASLGHQKSPSSKLSGSTTLDSGKVNKSSDQAHSSPSSIPLPVVPATTLPTAPNSLSTDAEKIAQSTTRQQERRDRQQESQNQQEQFDRRQQQPQEKEKENGAETLNTTAVPPERPQRARRNTNKDSSAQPAWQGNHAQYQGHNYPASSSQRQQSQQQQGYSSTHQETYQIPPPSGRRAYPQRDGQQQHSGKNNDSNRWQEVQNSHYHQESDGRQPRSPPRAQRPRQDPEYDYDPRRAHPQPQDGYRHGPLDTTSNSSYPSSYSPHQPHPQQQEVVVMPMEMSQLSRPGQQQQQQQYQQQTGDEQEANDQKERQKKKGAVCCVIC